MNTSQFGPNLIAYALQIGLLVGIGALAPPVFRLPRPPARLLSWHALLVTCLVLPWVEPWRQEVIALSNANLLQTVSLASANSPAMATAAAAFAPAHGSIPFATIVLWLLLAEFCRASVVARHRPCATGGIPAAGPRIGFRSCVQNGNARQCAMAGFR